MYNKLLGITFWNSASSLINFVSNYFIVKWLGIAVLGEFSIYSAYIALGSLIYSIIPSNYSIFKYQDDKPFASILYSFFILATILFASYLFILQLVGFSSINFLVLLLFGLPLGLQGYFDITLQARNHLNRYFLLLFIIAFSKVLLLFCAHQLGYLFDLEHLILFYSIPQALITCYLLVRERIELNNIGGFASFSSVLSYIGSHKKIFKSYYLNTFLKKIHENSILLFFQNIASKETIGLFTLFIKLDVFVLSQMRAIEAFFYNRGNLSKYLGTLQRDGIKFIAIIQAIYFLAGVLYIKIFTGYFYLATIFFMSFTCIFYYKFILSRSMLMSKYQNSILNGSSMIFIFISCIGFCIAKFIDSGGQYMLYSMLLTYFFAFQAYYIYTIWKTAKPK